MPTLRALLTWLVLPLLLILLLPEILRLLPMLRDGLLYEWLRDLPWRYRAGFGLLTLVAAALPILARLERRLDVLAARSFLPLWRDRLTAPGSTAAFNHAGIDWRVTLTTPGTETEPPGITLEPAGGRARRRLEQLLILAWRLQRAR